MIYVKLPLNRTRKPFARKKELWVEVEGRQRQVVRFKSPTYPLRIKIWVEKRHQEG